MGKSLAKGRRRRKIFALFEGGTSSRTAAPLSWWQVSAV
jgi:hypothetical protein